MQEVKYKTWLNPARETLIKVAFVYVPGASIETDDPEVKGIAHQGQNTTNTIGYFC